ncbi:autotransporter domain-containing protein [Parasaccharibacter sp. TMW2.1890]|uniref:autotransporter domain-containing protein n=1 Tax=Parasaccharibacter sp. TMW2.1890 TaxID=2039289 RepID=UPI002013390C
MLITGQSGQAPLRYLASHKAGYRRFGYMLALLSGVSLVAGVGSVARADDGASVSSGDMTNTQTRNLPQGTEVKGDLYQKDGQLGLDGTSVAGTLHLDGGTAIFGHNGASHGGTLVQSLAGSADAVLDKAGDNTSLVMTPSPDLSAPYQGELAIAQGKGETYGGSLKGTGVLSLLSGTQVLTGQNQIDGTVDIRNGTLILRDKGSLSTAKGSPIGPLSVGLARGNEGHLVLEGPDARIQRKSVFIGNGDPTYGGGSGPIGKSDATLTDGAQINNRTNEGAYVAVGIYQNGELNVENGSRVEADEFYAAASPSLTGTVNVTGRGSAVEATNAHIGNEGTGVVNISDGASFRADEARFGEDGGNGSLVVGVDGTMQNGNTIIGAGGKGTVTVDGGRFQNDGTIRFGVPGTGAASDGTLNVLDHGVLVAGDDGSSPAIAAEDGAKAAINLDAATIRNIQGRDFTSTVAANLTGMNEFNVQDSNTMSWKGGLTGDGGVDKTGTGTLGLSGNLAYKGMTNVEAGTLSVTDATLSGQVINQTNGTYVQKGGELDGTLANIGTASVDHTNVKGVVTNNSSFTATDSTLANLVNLGGNATLRNTLVHEVTSTEKSVLDFKDTVVDGRFANTGKVLAVHSKVPGLPSAADSESNSDVLAGRSGDSGATITNRMGDEDDLTNRAGSVPRKGNFTNGGDAEFYDSELATFTNTGTFLLAQKSVVNGDILQNDGKLTLDDSQVNGVLFARGGTFDITSGGASVESLAGRANGQLEGTLNLTKAADTYAGNISGNGGLTISGGRETLAGNNTYTGETDVTQNGGLTLKGSLASALNNAGTTDITGGRVAGTTTNSGTLTASKATLADVTNESGGTFSAAGGQLDSVVNNGNMTLDQGVIVHGNIAQHAGDLMLDGSKTKGVLAAHGGQLTIGNNGFTAGSLEGSGNAQLEGTLNLTNASSTYAGSMGGNGGLTVSGGHEVLTGNNSYSGNTLVQTGGQLDVNGDNSAAKGLTSVTDGATLRGTGTIGGDVNIGSGGTLAAGTAEAPSTLTVNGSLNLADGSRQVFRLGQADTEGGAYNDFINVKGNLALGGTLSIQPVDAGPDVNNSSLMAGLYRLYSYGGVLSGTQQSVDVASKPLPEGMVVQTSIDHQVNLAVNTGGFNYWDGGSSAHRSDDGRGNGRVDGGDGVWTAARPQGTPSWATADGSANGQWQNGNMAIFAASAGTVHVNDKAEDGTQAPVIFSGAQFANLDGKNYLVTGDNLYASTGKTVIRVGDGTSSGKDITAEIASVIDGSKVDGGTGLEKTDLGTLILSSDNDFAKPTHVEAGTLQLGNGGTTGSVGQQDIVNDGTLAVDHSNDVTLGQTISGTGSFVQKGQGTTTLSGANSYTGDTDVQNGRLNLTGSLAGNLNNAAATDVNGGKVAGTTTNTGTLTAQNATLADVANQAGTASLADSTAGHVTNADGATFKATGGTLASADNSGSMTLGAGNHVTGDVTNSRGDLTLDGNQIAGTTANHGQLAAQNATLADVANQAGTASLADSTAGHVTNADGATFKATGGTLASADNSGSMTLGAGNHVTGDVTNSKGDLTLDGNQIAGTLAANGGSFSVTDHGSDAGSLAGSGNGVLNGTLTLTNAKDTYAGSLSGNGGLTLSGGHETLTDQSHLGGPVSVAGGTLALAGAKAQLTTDSSVKIGAGKAGDVSLSDGAALHSHGPVVFAKAETAPADGTDARLDVLSGSRLSAGDIDGKPGLVAEEGAKAQLTLDGGTLQNIKGSDLTSNVNTAIGSKGAVFDVQDENRMTLGNNVVLTDDGSAGDHALTKTGTGVFTFAGDGSGFNGPTDIQSGDMIVDGNMSHSAMTVQHGAVLAGNGSVGSTVVSSGGMLGAGNETDAGALHVMGDLTMAKGSVLSIRGSNEATGRQLVAPDGFSYSELKSDQVLVSGKADLQGGTLALKVKDPTALKYGQAYHVLTANGGVNGHYDDLETNIGQDYAYLDPRLVYQGNDVDVMLRRSIHGFEYVGQTRNEIAAGEGLNHISENSDLAKAMTVLTKDQARHALNNLSGELHASIRTGLIQDSFYIRNAALNRLAAADCDYGHNGQSFYDLKTRRKDGACYSDHAVLWGQAYGGMGFNSGDGNAALMHHNTAGFVIGADGPINHSNWRVGGLISYGHSQFNVQRGRSSSANSNNISIGAYAGTHWGRLNLRFGAIYSWNVINTHRHVAVGDYGGRLSSSYLGGTAQGFGELGYKFRGERSMFEPFMNVAYVNMQSDSYREHGNEAALHSHGTDTGVTFSSFGFRTATTVGIGKAVFMPHLSAAYRHAFGRTGSRQRETFAMGSGAGDMDVAGVLLSRNAAVVQAGVTARVSERVDLDLSYIGQYGNQSTESGGTGSVKVRF